MECIHSIRPTASRNQKRMDIKKRPENQGYGDLQPVHRTEFSERCQNNMEEEMKLIKETTNDPELTAFWRKNIECFNAPVIVYLTLHKGHSKWSCYDLGGFGMALMLAAKDYGVDSVVAYELAKYPDVLRKYAKIPENEDICVGIALGYENDDAVNSGSLVVSLISFISSSIFF